MARLARSKAYHSIGPLKDFFFLAEVYLRAVSQQQKLVHGCNRAWAVGHNDDRSASLPNGVDGKGKGSITFCIQIGIGLIEHH